MKLFHVVSALFTTLKNFQAYKALLFHCREKQIIHRSGNRKKNYKEILPIECNGLSGTLDIILQRGHIKSIHLRQALIYLQVLTTNDLPFLFAIFLFHFCTHEQLRFSSVSLLSTKQDDCVIITVYFLRRMIATREGNIRESRSHAQVLAVKHCLLPPCLKCRISSTKELDPTPDHILCFSYACASCEEIAPPSSPPPMLPSFCKVSSLFERRML